MKNAKISSAIVFAIHLLGFMGIGILCGKAFADEENFGIFLLGSIGAALAAGIVMLIHILLHEAGHLTGGLLTGYQFGSFRIFGRMWQKDKDGKIKSYRFSVAGTAGQCIMSPPEMKDGKIPFFWYHIGGVLMNLIVSGLFAVLYVIFRGNPYVDFVSLSFVVLGLSMGLANGIPLPGITNDGRNIVELFRSEKAVKAFYLQMQAVAMIQKGTRIKDFPDEWFEMPTDEELKNTMICVMAVFLCDRLFDEGKYAEAQALIDELLQKETAIAPVHRELLKNNALFCELTGSKNKSKIENYLDKDLQSFMKAMKNYPSVIRTKLAYELLCNDDKQAVQKQFAMLGDLIPTYPYYEEIRAEMDHVAAAFLIAAEQKKSEEMDV